MYWGHPDTWRLLIINDAGQSWFSFLKPNRDQLSDHAICKFNAQKGDAFQLQVSGNTIEIKAYVMFKNAAETQKKQIRQGIKQWEGVYEYVFGHKTTVTIEIVESSEDTDSSQKYILFECMKDEDCFEEKYDVEFSNDLYAKRTFTRIYHSENYSKADVYLYPINAMCRFENGKQVFKEDGQEIYDIRRLTDNEYVNAITHEFGHVMLLGEGNGENQNSYFRVWGGIGGDDIMMTQNYEKDAKIYAFNYQMIITGWKERKLQTYRDWNKKEHITSTQVKCKNKKPED